ncbi:MAG: PaaI family thioesterase [Negativicutes bacterium]
MSEQFNHLKEILYKRYDINPFVKLLQITIAHLEEGSAVLDMPVLEDKHTNLFNVAHGGALAGLADTAMGVACATLRKKVLTLEMNMNFIRAATPQKAIRARGRVLHNGNSTIVAEAEIFDSTDTLLLIARGTFFVVGEFSVEGEPSA